MKKKRISNRTIALLAAAVLLLAGGTYTGTRAVLNIFSPEHLLWFETDSQYVEIQENGESRTKLLTDLSGKIYPGKEYDEQIRAKNITKDADQFVRIVIRKYWKDAGGEKATDIDKETLDKIHLTFVNEDVWQINDEETTDERVVYYYKNIVPVGGVTKPLTDKLSVDTSVATDPTVSGPDDNGIITYSYELDGYTVCIEAEAQSVQTHNTEGEVNAIKSIWGVTNVKATGSTLTVN